MLQRTRSHISKTQMIHERRLMVSPEIEFGTLADEALSAKYRTGRASALSLTDQ